MRQNFMVISVNYLSQLLQLLLKVFKSKQDVTIKVAREGVYRTKRNLSVLVILQVNCEHTEIITPGEQ